MNGQQQIPPQTPYYEDEIDLYELFMVLVKRKNIILLTTFVFTVVAALVAFLSTPKYKIGIIVRPGVTHFNSKGEPESDWKPQDLKSWIDSGAYKEFLYEKYKDEAPKIMSSLCRGGSIIEVYTYYPDKKEGKEIIYSVINQFIREKVSSKKNKRLLAEQKRLQTKIKQLEEKLKGIDLQKDQISNKMLSLQMSINVVKGDIEKQKLQIQDLKDKISNLEKEKQLIKQDINSLIKAKHNLEKRLSLINKNTDDLIKERMYMIKSNYGDKLSLLIFSNIIQDNLVYASNLEMRISDIEERITNKQKQLYQKDLEIKNTQSKIKALQINIETNLKKQIADLQNSISVLKIKLANVIPQKEQAIKSQIEELKAKLNLLSPIEIVQDVFASPKPVKPKKKLIVAVALVSGLFIGIFLAFFAEYIENARKRYQEEAK